MAISKNKITKDTNIFLKKYLSKQTNQIFFKKNIK